ncbi:MAG: hypothetical protein HQK55_14130, partial [Deltaproteobacteria bacterium]|nr:hypothetical protein [Deltaproteobacteria bacterium]
MEYQSLLNILAEEAQSETGAEYCRRLRPDLSPEDMLGHWRMIGEAKGILAVEGPPPLGDLPEAGTILSRLSMAGLVLRPLDLVAILKVVRVSRLVRGFILARRETAPLLAELAGDIQVYPELEHSLERSLGPEGEILDTASVELTRIRRELSQLRGAIQNTLTSLMRADQSKNVVQDQIITRRGGRYVIPVRVSARKEIHSLVHDYSKSGATAFIEPLEVVEDNNRLNFLRRKEKQEIERILARLTAMAAQIVDGLTASQNLLTRLDSLMAMAVLSRRQRAWAPELDMNGGVDLRQARHPLLIARSTSTWPESAPMVVPLDLKLTPDQRTLVVSGINAGGKTVAMKTLGLLILMAQTGFHLPVAEGSRLPFFDQILAAMGDEQDLSSDLSTFSGHIRRLNSILSMAADRTLILLDELGTGTDPTEGAALALAVLDELKERQAWVMAATHYHLLKAWAQMTPGAGNASVRTDENGRPVFGLDYGTPGYSAGLAMARDFGLDPEVIRRAESYVDEGQKKTLELIGRLEKERAGLAAEKAECAGLTEELALALARTTAADKKRALAHETELKSVKQRVDQAIAQAEAQMQEVRRQIKTVPRSAPKLMPQVAQIKSQLRQVVPQPVRPVQLTSVKPGDRVLVISLGKEGRVLTINGLRGQGDIDLDGYKVHT